MIKKINIFLLDPTSNRPFLIDELIVNFGQLMKLSYIDPTQKLFSIRGQTQNAIFENRYSAQVYLNGGSSVCTQSISIKDAVSAQKSFGLTFNANIAINYQFFIQVFIMIQSTWHRSIKIKDNLFSSPQTKSQTNQIYILTYLHSYKET
ncbi:hypothetical protein ABPG72_018766 [Tetrahymena utriculariae]